MTTQARARIDSATRIQTFSVLISSKNIGTFFALKLYAKIKINKTRIFKVENTKTNLRSLRNVVKHVAALAIFIDNGTAQIVEYV